MRGTKLLVQIVVSLLGVSPQSATAQSVWQSLTPQAGAIAAVGQWGDGTSIIARCDAGKLTAFLHIEEAVADAVVYVLTQREADDPFGGYWGTTSDRKNLFARAPASFARDLHQGGRMDFVIKSRSAPDREMSLMLPTENEALSAVLNACDVSTDPNPAFRDRLRMVWAVPPRPMANDFPEAALQANRSGKAAINCASTSEGRPEQCFVVDEAPTGLGFGAAAIRIVMRGRLRADGPQVVSGESTNFTVFVPMTLSSRPAPTLPFAERIIAETEGLFPEPPDTRR